MSSLTSKTHVDKILDIFAGSNNLVKTLNWPMIVQAHSQVNESLCLCKKMAKVWEITDNSY